jgi:hypothetical protein
MSFLLRNCSLSQNPGIKIADMEKKKRNELHTLQITSFHQQLKLIKFTVKAVQLVLPQQNTRLHSTMESSQGKQSRQAAKASSQGKQPRRAAKASSQGKQPRHRRKKIFAVFT